MYTVIYCNMLKCTVVVFEVDFCTGDLVQK